VKGATSFRSIETPSGRISYVEAGSGPVTLFVHGVLMNKYLWRKQFPALSDVRRCIAVDLLAHGNTEISPDQDVSATANAHMLREVLDALQIDKVDVIGNDSGGGMPSSQRALMDATKKRAEKLQAKGKTVDFKELLRMEPDSGTTNIRNTKSGHWKRWLDPEHRCLVPFTSFSEYDTIDGKKVPVWFAPDESRPLLAFGGIWTNWTSVRKAKESEVTADIFGFLTCGSSGCRTDVRETEGDEARAISIAAPAVMVCERPCPNSLMRDIHCRISSKRSNS
jgi:putative SOS response-associated peptidase YedK